MDSKKPEMGIVGPVWFHHHGIKMTVESGDSSFKLFLSGSAASLGIVRDPLKNVFEVNWKVVFAAADPVQVQKSEGMVVFSEDELCAAFGLSEHMANPENYWLIERFGGNSACQGKYIRWENYLNIPCPGTGYDGDPNVSIFIDSHIKEAVKKLLCE